MIAINSFDWGYCNSCSRAEPGDDALSRADFEDETKAAVDEADGASGDVTVAVARPAGSFGGGATA